MPNTWAMCSGLFDLRSSPERVTVAFFSTVVARKVVMFHQFVNKTNKTPPKELVLARLRMKEWKHVDA